MEWFQNFWEWLLGLLGEPIGFATAAVTSAVISSIISLIIKSLDKPVVHWEIEDPKPYWGYDLTGDLHGPGIHLNVVNTGTATAQRVRFLGFYCGEFGRDEYDEEYTESLLSQVGPNGDIRKTFSVHTDHWDKSGILITWYGPKIFERRLRPHYKFLAFSDYANFPQLTKQSDMRDPTGGYTYVPLENSDAALEELTGRNKFILEHPIVHSRKATKRETKKYWKRLAKQPWRTVEKPS